MHWRRNQQSKGFETKISLLFLQYIINSFVRVKYRSRWRNWIRKYWSYNNIFYSFKIVAKNGINNVVSGTSLVSAKDQKVVIN